MYLFQQWTLFIFPLSGDFVDYKSILNQYCQKEHINPPSYRPCASDSPYGGFGAECIVKSEVYRSHGHLKTKKEADHNAAYWALLKMDISLGKFRLIIIFCCLIFFQALYHCQTFL